MHILRLDMKGVTVSLYHRFGILICFMINALDLLEVHNACRLESQSLLSRFPSFKVSMLVNGASSAAPSSMVAPFSLLTSQR
jgi:hypothetical protein